MALTREQILAADDLRVDVVDVPQWGGEVRLREMNGVVRDELNAEIVACGGQVSLVKFRQLVVALSVVDDAGELIFGLAGFDTVRAKHPGIIDLLAERAIVLNGLGDKAVDDAKKPSETTLPNDSGSDSLSHSVEPSQS